jgi:hypothetical protein
VCVGFRFGDAILHEREWRRLDGWMGNGERGGEGRDPGMAVRETSVGWIGELNPRGTGRSVSRSGSCFPVAARPWVPVG